jgi:serine phosphatase RsbU (regulator of sigma subunit)/Tfp pilus assembly protein PilF
MYRKIPNIFVGKIMLLICFLPLCAKLQANSNHLDSLFRIIATSKNYDELLNTHLQLAYSYWDTNTDSCLFHLDKAEVYATTDEKRAKILIDRGILYVDKGEFDLALEIFTSALNIIDESNPTIQANIYGNIGNCYNSKYYTTKAIEYYRKAANIFESVNNEGGMARTLGMIGNILFQNDNYSEATQYYHRSMNLFKKLNIRDGYAVNVMNIGTCFKNINMVDSAMIYYSNALEMFESIGYMPFYKAQCLANIGNLHSYNENNKEAIKFLKRAELVFTELNSTYSLAQVNQDLAYAYLGLDKMADAKGKIDKSQKIIEEYSFDLLLLGVKRLLWKYYEKLQDFEKAHHWLNSYVVYKDSIDSMEKRKNLDMLLTEFELERKENEIKILKQSDEISQLQIRRRTNNLLLSLIGLVAAISFSVYFFINNQKRKRINQLLSSQNAEINLQKEEILSQRDEIESQRDLLQNQNNMLEEFRLHITDSLTYAQSIQASILPSEKVLQQISPDHFVLMKPCELVSGDFFWATTFDNFQIFCIADCTGHGVPGAFMSILGITALNDIVNRHRVTKPNEILGFLRESVIEALSQSGPDQLHKDGMDIALCVFNSQTRELQFAGAGIPLWLVLSEKNEEIEILKNFEFTEHNEQKLYEVKGDRMPVGLSPRMEPFNNVIIPLKNLKSFIYLTTDGFTDQLSERTKGKFGTAKLKRLVLDNFEIDFQSQLKVFEQTFDDWKGSGYQIDDVTMLGLKI